MNKPLNSPFNKEIFLIQSQGMERWLSQQLAQLIDVWANYQFYFPAKFFGHLTEKLGSSLKDDIFDRHKMVWRIETLLRDLNNEEFTALRHYLSGHNTELKRYQLSQELSQIFDQYQIMRPEMLQTWQNGGLFYNKETERWQRALWLSITQQLGNNHRGSLWLKTIEILNNAPEGKLSALLPERVFIFGMNTMPPLFLKYLKGLARHCEVHLFLLNPSSDYWIENASKRQQVIDENRFIGHPLLSSLGQQGREFHDIIFDFDIQFDDNDCFEEITATTLLQHLQNDILNNNVNTHFDSNIKFDNSISIHACHSRLREVEVLKHTLLDALEKNKNLQLRDMIVMSPDIQLYEPFISAVFSDMQHSIADRSLHLTNNYLDAFIRFLKVCQSRFGWQTVIDLLEQPTVYPQFNLSETDLELIKQWLTDTQVRWAKSAQHKVELGLPNMSEYTWQTMLDRLLLGYASSNDDDFMANILAYKNIEGSNAQALGGLCAFMDCLFTASEQLIIAKPLVEWTLQLSEYAKVLLFDDNNAELQQLYELFTELSDGVQGIHQDNIELQVIISWLLGKVQERKSANGFLRGQLTFCSMLPMRSIPFKVIALLGINNGEYPKVEHKPTFDLLADNFKKGDRSRRADDRYQFLEIILSTRQQLIITYIGQSINHNEIIPPSVITSELLDVLAHSYGIDSQKLITRHPLQAFSSRYFTKNTALVSYSQSDCETAIALQKQRNTESVAWWQGQLITETETTIELNEILRFFKHPQKYFMQRQLSVYFEPLNAAKQEREPFELDNLESYNITEKWIASLLENKAFDLKKLQARGHWLAGTMGELAFNKQQTLIDEFVARIKAKQLGAALEDLAIDIRVGQYRFIGVIKNRFEAGSLFYRYTPLKGKDFICALLQHHLLNQLKPHSTYLMSSDEDLILLPEHSHKDDLIALCELYQQGLLNPNSFFVEAAFAYIKQSYKLQFGRASKSALEVALETLNHSIEQDYELELQRLYGHCEINDLLNTQFEQYCQQLLQPVWNAVHS